MKYNCKYTGPAKPMTNSTGLNILKTYCPGLIKGIVSKLCVILIYAGNPYALTVLMMNTDPLSQDQWNFVRTSKFFSFYLYNYIKNKLKKIDSDQ